MDKLKLYQEELESVVVCLGKLGSSDYADTIADYKSLDESKKSILASEYMRLSVIGGKRTATELTQLALSSEDYAKHLGALKFAHKRYETARLKKEILFAKMDALRTLIAVEKAKIKIL